MFPPLRLMNLEESIDRVIPQTPWKILRPNSVVVFGTLAFLFPFVNRAFNIDDPLFLWAARWITSHPFDFYGFPVNWYGVEMPMSEVMKNPPLTSYYLALIGKAFGFSEWAIHLGLFPPAILCTLGIFHLADRFCKDALLAAGIAIVTPVFLVSATMVMSDVLMLSFWVWALHFWVKGVDSQELEQLFIACLLAAAAVLTKYSALCLFPLFILYGCQARMSPRFWSPLLLPVTLLGFYQWKTAILYGHGLLFDGANYSLSVRFKEGASVVTKIVVGLSFVGGSFLFVSFLSVGRALLVLAALSVSALIAIRYEPLRSTLITGDGSLRWAILIQLLFFILAGIHCVALLFSEMKRRDSDSLFLVAWIAGVFVFTSFVNWTVNCRSILPMLPAISILIVRNLDVINKRKRKLLGGALVLNAVLTLCITLGDAADANSARVAAQWINENYGSTKSPLFFQGHWGFQYYMQEWGAKALDFRKLDQISAGANVVIPLRNTNVQPLPPQFQEIERIRFPSLGWVTTLDPAVGAGFYTDLAGPLPFFFGEVNDGIYIILKKGRLASGP
jgi:4-amino-4-deoxy-L-arabinose transferase-like glycosyltransferase